MLRRVPFLAPMLGLALMLGPAAGPLRAQETGQDQGAKPPEGAAAVSPASQPPASPAPASEEPASQSGPTVILLGTGSLAGVYYPVGVALCRLPNQHRPETGLRCAAVPSEGSVANIEALRAGEAGLALAQTDVAAEAIAGAGAFAQAGPMEDLRAVMSLYPEPLSVVARADAGIASLTDLQGKRVALGQQGSGQRALAETLVAALGWSDASFAETPDLAPEDLAAALCGGRIDAYMIAIGHPALVIRETTRGCDARLVPAGGAAVDRLVADTPALVKAEIPGGVYRGNPDPTPSFGPGATLLTRAETPDPEVRDIISGILGDFDMLTGLVPVLAGLDRKAAVTGGLGAPLHPAAEAYYREAGLLP
ncbi:TAXI family TRAP transporter solute-binding subunit [Amaricoccus solimangrovi]|uniref:TAXI family TRAP transporter solute-binding subunit n=1 Tax=Amaricoccus solimangrovi TaxID=2589815 RepID=A0A501WKV6_9RHOB|nr:TAXI family TRAP transporter solute-binding subunit [Amaricoccus solimangrovi]TPE49412.1 TAXI family TRAP transporter solute-binding subunit [Amaricoccus solimangrovi]